MKKIFKKHELLISILLIIIYILSNSYCINNFGLMDYRSVVINTVLSIIIVILIIKNKLANYYGLTTFPNLKKYLYFFPLLLMISVNLWNGININNTKLEILFYILNMINVGFIEEIIFRGFLFKSLEKDGIKKAILITSISFGVGHIINLINGAPLIPTLIQICYAITGGYLFAIILYKSKSIWPCIITHSLINALSIFNIDNTLSIYIMPIFLILISLFYSMYINKFIK